MPRYRKTLYIGEKRWKVLRCKLSDRRGDCHLENKQIRISDKLEGKELVEILVHEIVHARVWDLDEEAVEDIGIAVSNALANWYLIKGE
tara:strand:- start:2528 stop:2794 length:267 start_codon:yes stop_codon:yes gene_type:complete